MARVRGAVVLAVFVGVAASLLPTHAALQATRARRHDTAIDATVVVVPDVVATTRRTMVRDIAHLVERIATPLVPLLLLLLAVFAGLALGEVPADARLRRRGIRTQ